MAGPYYVDDGGNGSDGLTWAKAETSINDLDAAVTFASGEIVYFGHDHVCQATNSANLTITGPTQYAPVLFISATQGSDPPTYAASSTNQIDTTEGAYSLTFDGSFALYGLCMAAGGSIIFTGDANEPMLVKNCTLKPPANGQISVAGNLGETLMEGCTIDLTADGTTARAASVLRTNTGTTSFTLKNLTFVNAGYRTGYVLGQDSGTVGAGDLIVSGCDFSGFTNATTCEIYGADNYTKAWINNCLTAATWTPMTTARGALKAETMFVNVGPADSPTSLVYRSSYGDVVSTTAIYRTGGATVESEATAWLITTDVTASESSPFRTPWIYGTVAASGSKTFDVYITNDTADFKDDEAWLEVESLSTSDEAISTTTTDQRASLTATAAAQTDDTASAWNGTGPSFTYKQKLSVTATVGEAGQFRARVCVAPASIASSRYFYMDPAVTVT